MNRREAKKEIEKVLAESVTEERVYQRKPWTCYAALGMVGEQEYRLLDFAKVTYPDKWSLRRGVELAKEKALAHQAKVVMLWFSFHRNCPQEVCPWVPLISKWRDGSLWNEPLSQQAYLEAVAEIGERCGVTCFDGLLC